MATAVDTDTEVVDTEVVAAEDMEEELAFMEVVVMEDTVAADGDGAVKEAVDMEVVDTEEAVVEAAAAAEDGAGAGPRCAGTFIITHHLSTIRDLSSTTTDHPRLLLLHLFTFITVGDGVATATVKEVAGVGKS